MELTSYKKKWKTEEKGGRAAISPPHPPFFLIFL